MMMITRMHQCNGRINLLRTRVSPVSRFCRNFLLIPKKLAKSNCTNMRISYDVKSLSEDSLVAKEPIAQFKNWFDVACKTPEILEPNAVCLATAAKNGRPSSRMVLLKGFSKDGFKCFTNYESRKGKELAENPFAALTFFWSTLHRSVRIEGSVRKLPEEDSIIYFNSRPRDSQLAACASEQSAPIAGKPALEEKFALFADKYSNQMEVIPKPSNWGGFIIVPDLIEFWQGQKDRMHDRIRFRKQTSCDDVDNKLIYAGEDGWVYERLSP